jgi:hypothetical protein
MRAGVAGKRRQGLGDRGEDLLRQAGSVRVQPMLPMGLDRARKLGEMARRLVDRSAHMAELMLERSSSAR